MYKTLTAMAFISAGAIAGYLAAVSNVATPQVRAEATNNAADDAAKPYAPAALNPTEIVARPSQSGEAPILLTDAGTERSRKDGKRKPARKPNIVFIMSDDVGWGDLGCYGGGIMRGAPTPHLDRLASEGMRFVNYYGQASCTAGRASFITGRIPVRTALSVVITPGNKAGLTNETPTVAQYLKKAGYHTVQMGKWHLGGQPENYPTSVGFDHMVHMLPWYAGVYAYPDPKLNPAWPLDDVAFQEWWKAINMGEWEGNAGQPAVKTRDFSYLDLHTCDTRIKDSAVRTIKEHEGKDNPLFLYCCFMKVHQPNFPAPEFKGKSPGQYPYLDSLMELDFNSGSVIDAVRNSPDPNIRDNTIIVWTTDNGAWIDAWPDAGYTPFRGEKGSCYEGGFRVPAIAWWPGHIKAGSVATGMMSHMDWWPTFSALADVPEDQRPKRFWKDNLGKPIIFDGIDQSDYILHPDAYSSYDQYTGIDPKYPPTLGDRGPQGKQPLKPAPRQSFQFFFDNTYGAVRHKQYKFVFTTKDNWLGPSSQLTTPAVFKLDWDPGEQYDIMFNGAAPTVGTMKSSPGRFAGPDHGWTTHYAQTVMSEFWDEIKIKHVPGWPGEYPYALPKPAPGGAALFGIIPAEFQPQ